MDSLVAIVGITSLDTLVLDMIDKRLLGTWRSDARRTLNEIRQRRNLALIRSNVYRRYLENS